ncbi:hypothetical protein BpHYR1_001646 [Brachionus plicatilis]|uniref:Uncharacterized protein n=1 Tax=Brachionus plicatilis TaxID=10195 RepID=A0A3M7P7C4_BRAPC|nr:hypothetical protein BpHYR1_001646 [Brachionus plicatilis]
MVNIFSFLEDRGNNKVCSSCFSNPNQANPNIWCKYSHPKYSWHIFAFGTIAFTFAVFIAKSNATCEARCLVTRAACFT